MNDFQNLVAQVRKLSLADQRVLNEILVGEIRHAVRVAAVTKSKEFKLGDIVSFVCTKRGRSGVKYVKVMDFSRDHTKVKGPEVSAKGEQMTPHPITWTVAVSLLSKV